jgi:hypothetical protein
MRSVRAIHTVGDIARIELTNGHFAIIDADMVDRVRGFNWHARKYNGSRTMYALRKSQRDSQGRQHHIYLHRVILPTPEGMQVDHINGDGLDNRRANLRLATPQENSCNRPISRFNMHGTKGITWHKRCCKWQAAIGHKGAKIYLGVYRTALEAHYAYIAASERLHGEFGRPS